MKTNVTISLDLEVARRLKEEKNKSALINSYLRKYFDLGNEIKTDKAEEKIEEEISEVEF